MAARKPRKAPPAKPAARRKPRKAPAARPLPPSLGLATHGRSFLAGAELNPLLADWIWSPLGPDDELRADLRRSRGRARDLARNNPYVRRGIALYQQNVIGPEGFSFCPLVMKADGTPDMDMNTELIRKWQRFMDSPVTFDEMQSGLTVQHHLLEARVRDGEGLARMVIDDSLNDFGFGLQILDADLLDETFNRPAGNGTNEIRMGVEFDSLGRKVNFHFWDRYETNYIAKAQRRRYPIPAREMFHLFKQERPNQTRGVTELNSVMVVVKHQDGLEEAGVVNARAGASKMGLLVPDPTVVSGTPTGLEQMPEVSDVAPGTLAKVPYGWKFQEYDPTYPNAEMDPFGAALLRRFAAGFGVCYYPVSQDWNRASFSSIRAALSDDRDGWGMEQMLYRFQFLRRYHLGWLVSSLLKGALDLPVLEKKRFEYCRFDGRGYEQIDPYADEKAAELRVAGGRSSRTREVAKRGDRFDEIASELAAEKDLATELDIQINGAANAQAGVGAGDANANTDGAAPVDEAAQQ